MTALPPGFVIDSAPVGGLPPGFMLDQPATTPPNTKSLEGASAPVNRGIVQNTVNAFTADPRKTDNYIGMIPMAQGLAKSAMSFASAPGETVQGKLDPLSDEAIGRMTEGAMLASPVSAASRAGPAAVAKAMIPERQEIKQAAQQGYEKAKGLGVEISPQSVQSTAQNLSADLAEKGIDAQLAPKTFGIIGKLEKPPADSVATIANMESVRRSLGHAAQDFTNPTEKLAARSAISHLDEYLAGLSPRDVLAGDANQAAKILSEARGNYAAAMRSESVAKALTKAERQASSAGSGGNIDNATRQQFKAILNSDKKSSGYSREELAQMSRLVEGTRVGNIARLMGKVAPTGIVSGGLSSGAGFVLGGPIGAVAVPAIGYAAKKLGDASTRRQSRILDEMIRKRSPLAQR